MTERLETVESNIGLLDEPPLSVVNLSGAEEVDQVSQLNLQIETKTANIPTSTDNPAPKAIDSIELVKAKSPTTTYNQPPSAIQRIELKRRFP